MGQGIGQGLGGTILQENDTRHVANRYRQDYLYQTGPDLRSDVFTNLGFWPRGLLLGDASAGVLDAPWYEAPEITRGAAGIAPATTWFVSKTGSDSNNGLTSGTAFLTIQKALNMAASGDTIYVGAGVYREQLMYTGPAPTTETKVIADVDGFYTGAPGEVQITSYLTNDKTAPASAFSPTIDLNGKHHFTWQGFTVIGSNLTTASCLRTLLGISDITLRQCTFINATNAQNRPTMLFAAQPADLTANILIDQCAFGPAGTDIIEITVTRSVNAEFDCGITVRNCLFLGGGTGSDHISFNVTGAATGGKPGGGYIQFCTFLGGDGGGFAPIRVNNNWSTNNPVRAVNCYSQNDLNSDVISAQTLGMAWEEGNIVAGPSSSGTSVWITGAVSQHNTYAPLIQIGQDRQWNPLIPRRVGEPLAGAPQLGFSPFSDVSCGVFSVAADDATAGTIAWTNPSNALVLAELAAQLYATSALTNTQVTHYLKLTGVTFYPTIPPGAVILGVEIELAAKGSVNLVHTVSSVKFFDGVAGAYQAEWISHITPNNSLISTTDVQRRLGGPSDLWGYGAGALTQTILTHPASGFGVAFTANAASTINLDGVRMFVFWKNPAGMATVDLSGRLRPSGGASANYAAGAYERQDCAVRQTGTVDTGTYGDSITGPGTQRYRVPVDNVATTIAIKLRYDSTYDATVSRPQVALLQNGEVGYAGEVKTASVAALNAWETQTFTAFTPSVAGGVVWLEVRSFDQNGAGKVFIDSESG